MKTVTWKIKMDDVTERFVQSQKEESYEEWCTKRCKMMLQDFYMDTKKEDLKTLADLRIFIDKWVKIHFQY